MHNYKTVLVAVDLAGGADEVLARAAGLSAQKGTRVVMLGVGEYPLPGYFPSYGADIAIPTDMGDGPEQIRADALSEMKSRVASQDLIVDHFIFEFGRPVEKIIDVAKSEAADLIIVGSHGRHGLSLLLGSTANGVLHRATCDVLTVRLPE